MAANGMFRTALFGGYNKEDVEEYITNLEHEIDAVKVLHQKEKNELVRQIKEMKESGPKSEEKLTEEAEGIEKAQETEITEATERMSGDMRSPVNEEEYEQLLNESAVMREKIKCAEEEIEKLRKSQGSDYFDYETVSRIMDEARRTAAEIEEEARKKAEKMIKDAREETERQKEIVVKRINAQLEEKGIELIAAKYKIEQYAKELDNAQQGLYSLNMRVKKMVEEMPVRLDDYWQGEHYRSLEKRLLQKTNEVTPENSSGKEETEVK